MTVFSAVLKIVGLSANGAAHWIGVQPDTVRSWSSGRNSPPQWAWNRLRDFHKYQHKEVNNVLKNASKFNEIDLEELTEIMVGWVGWPEEDSHLTILALAVLSPECPKIRSRNTRKPKNEQV